MTVFGFNRLVLRVAQFWLPSLFDPHVAPDSVQQEFPVIHLLVLPHLHLLLPDLLPRPIEDLDNSIKARLKKERRRDSQRRESMYDAM